MWYLKNWKSIQEDENFTDQEMYEILQIAQEWWQSYLSQIYVYEAYCAVCDTFGHSCKKKRDCPIYAKQKLDKSQLKVLQIIASKENKKNQQDLNKKHSDVQRVLPASKVVMALEKGKTLRGWKGRIQSCNEKLMTTLESSKSSLLYEQPLQILELEMLMTRGSCEPISVFILC